MVLVQSNFVIPSCLEVFVKGESHHIKIEVVDVGDSLCSCCQDKVQSSPINSVSTPSSPHSPLQFSPWSKNTLAAGQFACPPLFKIGLESPVDDGCSPENSPTSRGDWNPSISEEKVSKSLDDVAHFFRNDFSPSPDINSKSLPKNSHKEACSNSKSSNVSPVASNESRSAHASMETLHATVHVAKPLSTTFLYPELGPSNHFANKSSKLPFSPSGPCVQINPKPTSSHSKPISPSLSINQTQASPLSPVGPTKSGPFAHNNFESALVPLQSPISPSSHPCPAPNLPSTAPALGSSSPSSSNHSSPLILTSNPHPPPFTQIKRIRKPSVKIGPEYETSFPRKKGMYQKKPKPSVPKTSSKATSFPSHQLPIPKPPNTQIDNPSTLSDAQNRSTDDLFCKEAEATLEIASCLGLVPLAKEEIILKKLVDMEKADSVFVGVDH